MLTLLVKGELLRTDGAGQVIMNREIGWTRWDDFFVFVADYIDSKEILQLVDRETILEYLEENYPGQLREWAEDYLNE